MLIITIMLLLRCGLFCSDPTIVKRNQSLNRRGVDKRSVAVLGKPASLSREAGLLQSQIARPDSGLLESERRWYLPDIRSSMAFSSLVRL
jgi:hypothetical protein